MARNKVMLSVSLMETVTSSGEVRLGVKSNIFPTNTNALEPLFKYCDNVYNLSEESLHKANKVILKASADIEKIISN